YSTLCSATAPGCAAPYALSLHDALPISDATPSYEELLEVRRGRVREVRDFLAALTPEEAGRAAEPPPWMDQSEPFVVGQCVWVVLSEEWEHHQFATRDLDFVEAGAAASA